MNPRQGLVIDDLPAETIGSSRKDEVRRHQQVSSVPNGPRSQELLLFELSARRCALLAREVIEIVRAVEIRRLPHAPLVVEGIIDLRGEIVPVLDIRSRFGLPARPLRPSDHLIVVLSAGRKVALRVDRALSLLELEILALADAVHLPEDLRHLAGVTSLEGELVLIHDLQAFLSQAEAVGLAAALAAEAQATQGGAP
jgi:purine-binding chemotaxis protein CheW